MKAICIDDEKLALEYLIRQISKIKTLEVIGSYTHPLDGMKHILQEDVDIVFLDIQLPEINGLELAERINEKKPDVPIVFVTAFDKYAVKAFELNAIDYLVKPIKLERLQMTVDRIIKQLSDVEEAEVKMDYLRVKVSNYLQFETTPDDFQPIQWRTAKTQELFLYLLKNNGEVVEKSTLMELLWGVHERDRGYSLLYTTVYNVRKALRPYGEHIILHNATEGYLLELKNVTIDLVDWEKAIMNLPKVNEATIKKYEAEMDRNKGPYLLNHDYIWIEAERHRLENIWLSNAKDIAAYYETTENVESAIKWYERICERQPENEDAHFALMKIYENKNEYGLVAKQYRKLISVLRDELAVEPSDYIRKWYEKQIIQKVKKQNINYPS